MAVEIHPQLLRSQSGDELVVLTRAEYDALSSAAAEALEDAADIAIYDARIADLHSGRDAILPPEISSAILRGESLLRALRKWRDMTQLHLAHRTNLTQGYLSELEAGRKTATP
ncbi:MAG: helix-turn-helix transcriptional regulator, partial [Hyphomicrobiales bacterium]|nr:helix-turn-helix transcriptional regulator [Hyphomicrobiales bacterium]